MWVRVFQNLQPIHLRAASLVCKDFHRFANDDGVWNYMSMQEFGIPTKGKDTPKEIYKQWKDIKITGLYKLTSSEDCLLGPIDEGTQKAMETLCSDFTTRISNNYIHFSSKRATFGIGRLYYLAWACAYISITIPGSKILAFSRNAKQMVGIISDHFLLHDARSVHREVFENTMDISCVIQPAFEVKNGSQIYCVPSEKEIGPMLFNECRCKYGIANGDKCYILVDYDDGGVPLFCSIWDCKVDLGLHGSMNE